MKTKEELNALKIEVKALNAKLAELDDEEMKQVVGGTHTKKAHKVGNCPQCQLVGRLNTLFQWEDIKFCKDGHIYKNDRYAYKNLAEIINIPCE